MEFLIIFFIFLLIQDASYSFTFINKQFQQKQGYKYHLKNSNKITMDSLQNSIQFYNTITRRKEKFIPLDPRKVSFYRYYISVLFFKILINKYIIE